MDPALPAQAALPKPAPNRAARQAAVKAHIRATNSGDPRRQAEASEKLSYLNMAPTHQPKPPKLDLFQQSQQNPKIRAARRQVQRDIAKPYQNGPIDSFLGNAARSISHHATDFGHYFVEGLHTSPLLGDLGNKEQARRSAKMTQEMAPYAKAFLPQSAFDIAEGKLPSLKAAGEDAAFFLPGSRLLRGASEAIKAARVAEEGTKVAEAAGAAAKSYREGKGVVGGLAGAAAKHRPRMVKFRGAETQFPLSPSHFTQYAQRGLDRLSERVTPKAEHLLESDNPLARAAGKTLTKASSRARVPIQAGKNFKQEMERAQALRANEVRAATHPEVKYSGKNMGIKPSVLHGGEGSQLAHFWWAQLSPELRNVKGLQLVRDALAKERDTAVAGAKTAEDARVVKDLNENIRRLDKVIARPPKLNNEALSAVETLNRDREEILTKAGKLDPAVAKERKGLVMRWLGLEPTGKEIYVGHRLHEGRGGEFLKGIGLGKSRVPKGAGLTHKNELVLAKTGRAEQSLRVPVRDWQAAQQYHFHNQAKDELAQMGEPIGPEGPKPGHVVVNPNGHELPRTWKVNEYQRALSEGFHPEESTQQDIQDYVHNYIAEGPDRTRLIEAATNAGKLKDLRQVPNDVVRRYVSQVLPYRQVKGVMGGTMKAERSVTTMGADLAHDLLYTSLIYSNPHYIPLVTTQNLIFAGLHQGAFLPSNLMRAGQLIFQGPRDLKKLLDSEVVFGASKAIESGGKYPGSRLTRGFVRGVTSLHDDFPRISSFIHEAARYGVISKASPILSKSDYAALKELLVNPKYRPLLNDIRDAANQAQVDFNRLGAKERYVAKRLGFVWAWTRGATRYPARFALDHPIRTVALAYAAMDAPGMPKNVRDELRKWNPADHLAHGGPSYMNPAISLGNEKVLGKKFPEVLPLRSVFPASTPLSVLETAREALSGSSATGHSLANFLNPMIPAGVQVAQQKTPFGQNTSLGGALAGQAQQLTPARGLIQDMISPPGKKELSGHMYPSDATREGRLIRAFGGPEAVNPEQEYKARVKEGDLSQQQKNQHRTGLELGKLNHEMKVLNVPPAWRQKYRRATTVQQQRDIAKAAARKASPNKKLSPAQSYKVTMQVLLKSGMMSRQQYSSAVAAIPQMNARELKHWEYEAWAHLGPGSMLEQLHHYYNVKTGQ